VTKRDLETLVKGERIACTCCDSNAAYETIRAAVESLCEQPCPRCDAGADDDGDAMKLAVWIKGQGWLVNACGGSASTSDRLRDATWFDDEHEAAIAVAEAELDPWCYEVVPL
jgi:hypothetical protein